MFPLSDLLKTEVKQIANDNGLEKFAAKKESMGICFIGSRNFQDFISEVGKLENEIEIGNDFYQYIPDNPGDFVNIDTGQVIGKHEGIHKWTIGQRSKISGLSEAHYIALKLPQENVIAVVKKYFHLLNIKI